MRRHHEYVVGVDVGSSSTRAIAINRSGEVLATSATRYGTQNEDAGEADPEVWLAATIDSVARIDADGSPKAICVGGHGPTTVALSGELAITFRHPAGHGGTAFEQAAGQAAALRKKLGRGTKPRQLWDWLLSRMGGSSSTQGTWPDTPILDGFGDSIPVGTSVGVTRGISGIPDGIHLVPGANDAYMTTWGSGVDTPGKAFDPGGKTGGLGVAVVTGPGAEFSRYGMPSAVPGVYIVGGPVAAHGAMLDWWAGITRRSIPELLELAAEAAPGAGGVMVLPFLEGERAPRWNPGLSAEILGLHAAADVGVVARAILEGTAYGLGHLQRSLEDRGIRMDRLISSGGPSRSRLWTQIKADVLEVPIDVPSCSQMASYGSALGAGAGVGWWPIPGAGKSGDWPHPDMTTIQPQPRDVYRYGLSRFIELGDEAEARLGGDRSAQ